jgi:hypothetical protein
LSKRILVSTAVTAALIVMVLSNSSRGWAQDRVPIGTVPLFPPASKGDIDTGAAAVQSLVQLNLGKIEISKNVNATGLEGRLAVRTALHLTLSDSLPQEIHLPVQIFGENILGSLTDLESGITFRWDNTTETGELTIPFGDELIQGIALIRTGQMTAQGNTVAAEVHSVRLSVGEFPLGNETQVGGVASIDFQGMLVPEVFLVGLEPLQTAEVATIWNQSDAAHDDLVLVDILASTSIEAGFIGRFDGDPVLKIRTDNSWRSSAEDQVVQVLGEKFSGKSTILSEQSYSLLSEDQSDVFMFDNFSDVSRIAIVLTEPRDVPVGDPTVSTLDPSPEIPTAVLTSGISITPTVEAVRAEPDEASGWLIWFIGGGVLITGVSVLVLRLARGYRD